MAEMKREVGGEIRASLVNPPQDNAILSGVKGILEVDKRYQLDQLQADQQFEQERFQAEGMEAKLQIAEAEATGVGATVFNGNTAASADALDPKDASMLSDTAKALKTNSDGLQQGATSYTQSLINQERILKNAIRSRPWLKEELLAASANYLGMDVYQQGYKALAANEAARADAKNAEMKAAQDELKAIGERAWQQGIPQVFMSLFPDSQPELNTMSPAETAAWMRANKDNPQLKRALQTVSLMDSTKSQFSLEKNQQDLTEIRTNDVMKELTRGYYKQMSDSAAAVLGNKDFYDANGGLNPLGAKKIGEWAATQRIAIKDSLLNNLPPGADSIKAEEKVGVLLRALDDMVAGAGGKDAQALTKGMLDQRLQNLSYLVQTSPELASSAAYLMSVNPGLSGNPDLLNTMAASMGGLNLVGANQNDIATFYRDNGAAASSALQGAVIDMTKTLDPVQKATARSGVRKLLLGGSVNLTLLSPETMILDPAMRNIATSTFVDLKRALLTPDGGKNEKGEATTVLDGMSEVDRVTVGTNLLKSAINLQESLLKAPQSDSSLKRFATKVEGRKLLGMADGAIKAELPGPLSVPEQRYLALVAEHNKRIAGVGAVYNTAVGVPPNTRIDKATWDYVKTLKVSPPSASTYAPSNFSMYAPAVLGQQGGAGKKSQGAQAPKTGTKVYKAGDRDSLVGYAEGLRGAESGGSFNVQYGGKKVPVTDMTVGQVLAYQEGQKAQGKQTAIGAYQFTQATLKDALKRAEIPEDARFDVKTQNKVLKAHTEFLAEKAKEALGRDPTYGEMYLLHFQGEGDGKAMLAAGRNASVDSWFNEKEKAKNPVYAKARTVGDLIDLLESKWA